MTWRYLAQQALTGELLDLELPLAVDELSWQLSGPGGLAGRIEPAYAQLKFSNGRPIFEEWASYLYAEYNGELRWGGILQSSTFTGPQWALRAAGFLSYPKGIPYTGPVYTKVNADPTQIYRDIWAHLQTQPDGNLGVTVTVPTACPARTGTTEEPYSLSWWEAPDCGAELDTLTTETPFDVTEGHEWSTGQTIAHTVTVWWPRKGRRRDDLRFTPDNMTAVLEVARDGASFANVVWTLGKGEGAKTVRGFDGERDGRLRRPFVYTEKMATSGARASSLSRRERLLRRLDFELSSVTVQDHPNAPLGSWALGDDILIEAELEHVGKFAMWHRVVGWQLVSDSTATLQLARSDTFRYGAL